MYRKSEIQPVKKRQKVEVAKKQYIQKKIKIVRFLNILFVNMYFRDQKASSIISGSITVTDIQTNCFVQSAVIFIHILYSFKILLL